MNLPRARKGFRSPERFPGKRPGPRKRTFAFLRAPSFVWQDSTVGENPSRPFHKRSRQPQQPVEKVPWPRGPGLRRRARRADGGDAQAHRQGGATPLDGCKSGPPGGLRRFSRRSSLDDGGQTALGYALVVRLLRRENHSQRGSRDFFNRLSRANGWRRLDSGGRNELAWHLPPGLRSRQQRAMAEPHTTGSYNHLQRRRSPLQLNPTVVQ